MKFSSLLVSTILAAIAGTSTAESTCCNALESEGCDATSAFPVLQSGQLSISAAGINYVHCCADIPSTSIVNNMNSNPTCAGSETPPPAPVPAPVEPPIPTVIDNIDANTPMTGMPDAAASCEALESQFDHCTCAVQCQDGETKCLEADSAGCDDAANTFCAGQGSSVYLSCGHTETHSHSETHSETHSGTTTTTTTTTGSTEYVCNNGEYCTLSSNGGLCSPIGQGLPFGNTFMPTLSGEGASTTVPFTCIGINGSDLVSGGGSCQMSCPDTCKVAPDVTNPCGSTGGTPSPTPSAGFTSSTSVAIGASVAFLAMIFV